MFRPQRRETDRTRLSNGGSMGEMQNDWALVLLTLADFFKFLCMQLLPDGHWLWLTHIK
jgi:hypothetical protein